MLSALEEDLQEKHDKIKICLKQDWEMAKWELWAECVGGKEARIPFHQTFKNRKKARVEGRFLFVSLLKIDLLISVPARH